MLKNLVVKKSIWTGIVLTLAFLFVAYDAVFNYVDWRNADRNSAGLAPAPTEEADAVVQLYAARTYNWRKYFAVHSWIAVKEKNADSYTIYQVLGFKKWRTGNAIDIQKGIPDRKWFGAMPELLKDIRGEEAEKAIVNINNAVKSYPYGHLYTAFPGPNSNTFISYIIRRTPELATELPPTAIGKDFIGFTNFVEPAENGQGYQFSVLGIFGATVTKSGFEVNLLGLVLGLDVLNPAIKLPFLGRLGMNYAQ